MKKRFVGGLALALVLFGCGGNAGSGSVDRANTARIDLVATDSGNTAYDQVWATVHRVEVSNNLGYMTIFDSPEGEVMNLTRLSAGGQPRYSFLGSAKMKPGIFNDLRVTLAGDLSVVPLGSTQAQPRIFGGRDAATGLKVFSVSLNKKIMTSAVVLMDFTTELWGDDGSRVQPLVRIGLGKWIDDPLRHNREQFEGLAEAVSGGRTPTFNVKLAGGIARVVTSSKTAFFNSAGTPNPLLIDGKRVHVVGTYDPSLGLVVARSVKIQNQSVQDDDVAELQGTVAAFDGHRFTLRAIATERFYPAAKNVPIELAPGARTFLRGVLVTPEAFQAVLASGATVEVEGTYDPMANLFVATRARVQDASDDTPNFAAVSGPLTVVDPVGRTLTVATDGWEGILLAAGTSMAVTTTASTVYRVGTETVQAEAFFAAILAGSRVRCQGRMNENGNGLEATEIRAEVAG